MLCRRRRTYSPSIRHRIRPLGASIQFTASISSLKVPWRRDRKLDQAIENDKPWKLCARLVREVLNEPGQNDSIGKRMKSSSKSKDETCGLMVETESTSRAITKQNEQTNKSEPPKEYIHVRARRGQATDSHSLAERARREKISERMKILQDLVPGCNKVIGKALVLDEIINYIQSLQCQVEFLSMKLEAVNCKMNPTLEAFSQKDLEPATTFHPSGMLLDTQPAPRDYTRETHQEWLHMHQIGSSFEKGL